MSKWYELTLEFEGEDALELGSALVEFELQARGEGPCDVATLRASSLVLSMARKTELAHARTDPLANGNVADALDRAMEYTYLRLGRMPRVARALFEDAAGSRVLQGARVESWERKDLDTVYGHVTLEKSILRKLAKGDAGFKTWRAVRNALGYLCASGDVRLSEADRFRTLYAGWNALYSENARIGNCGSRHECVKLNHAFKTCKLEGALAAFEALARECGGYEGFVRSLEWDKALKGAGNVEKWFSAEGDNPLPDALVARVVEEAARKLNEEARSGEIKGLPKLLRRLGEIDKDSEPDPRAELVSVLRYYVYQLRNATVHGARQARGFSVSSVPSKSDAEYAMLSRLLRFAMRDLVEMLVARL